MIAVGIDLAAQPRDTAYCRIRATKMGAGATLAVGLDDDALVGAFGMKTGIDAPFGWPLPFVDAIVAHRDGREWPGRDADDPDAFRKRLRLRRTDLFVREHTGISPLSVSSEKIGVAAMRCALVLDRAASRGVRVARHGVSGNVCEVYPAAALKCWYGAEVAWRGYKGRAAIATREPMVARLLEDTGVEVREPELMVASDHALDAFVSALVAAAAAIGRTIPPRDPDERRIAAVEGWIHLPRPGDGPRRFP